MTPSAYRPISRACSAVETPRPTQTGRSVAAFVRSTRPFAASPTLVRGGYKVAAAVLVLARGWSSLRRQKAMSVRYAIARGADDGPLLPLLMSTAAKNAAAAAASNRHSQKPENLRRRFLLDHDLPGTPRPLRYLHSSDWKS